MQKQINIPILARVEGEGALDLKIANNKIKQLQLKIYEPPRLFEKFLEGREPNEVIDAVARICGICPVAYQMSAAHALEYIFNMQLNPWVREMRRLFYCGEWMESHGIHIHMLAAPDFLGFNSLIDMAKKFPDVVKRGLHLHALGMELMNLLGQRSVHPVGACVGGFFKAPEENEVHHLFAKFQEALPLAAELVNWACQLPLPDIKQDFIYVAMQHPDEYAMNEGDIVTNTGLKIQIEDYDLYFKEQQASYSTALQAHLKGEPYLVGPLARINLNYHLIPEEIKTLLMENKISFPSNNMFHSIIARAVEIYYSMLEAIRIMQSYYYPEKPHPPLTPKAGVGFGCTEAPRGLLWHRYETDKNGLITNARIVPPTSQNQARIEQDLAFSLQQFGFEHSDDELRLHSEMVIRNYDPCISCSTHFLTLNVQRH